jgi:pimeloyl-ACP methyl ester carboxylesterase
MDSMHEVKLSAGTIRYREAGSGPPVVFVHGLLVDGTLWRKVVPLLAPDARCIVPDWPLGSHTIAMNEDADLSPRGIAGLVAEFLEALELDDVTIVANDTGGAISQLLVTERPERIGRLVLTPCDAFENFPPEMFRGMKIAARTPGGMTAMLAPMRIAAARNAPMAFGRLAKHGIPAEVSEAWVRPAIEDAGVRRDCGKTLRALDPKDTLDAAARLHAFDRPVLIAWAPEDRFFPFDHGQRLAKLFPQGRLERIEDSWSFVSEDQPERLAELVRDFVRELVPAAG